MREIECHVAVNRTINGHDDVYILSKVSDMTLNELRERVKAGATLVVLGEYKEKPEALETKEEAGPNATIIPKLLPKRQGGNFQQKKPYDKAKLFSLFNAGWTYKAIAEELGITYSAVTGAIARERRKEEKKKQKGTAK